MEAEVSAHEACRELHKKSAELEERREELEDQLRFYQQRFKDLSRKIEDEAGKNGVRVGPEGGPSSSNGHDGSAALSPSPALPPPPAPSGLANLEAERGRAKRAVERIRGHLRQVDAEAIAVEREIGQRFHPYWGSLLKEANETSSFGDQVEEYACL